MFVPCGHCTNCVTNYRNNLARRLDLEREGSVSCLFFTLTYDNEHIPTFTPTYKDIDGSVSLILNKNHFLDVENQIDLPKHLEPSLSELCPLQIGRNNYIPEVSLYNTGTSSNSAIGISTASPFCAKGKQAVK